MKNHQILSSCIDDLKSFHGPTKKTRFGTRANINIYIHIYRSMGRIIPYIMEKKKCLKPPTSIYIGQHPFPSKKQSFSIANCIFFPSRNGSTREASSGRSKSTSLVPWKSLVWEAVFGDFQWTIQKSPYTNNLIPVLCMYIYIYAIICMYIHKYICNYMHVYTYIYMYTRIMHVYI
jgi:hypothetical protein